MLARSLHPWILSALICEPESRSAGIVGNFFAFACSSIPFVRRRKGISRERELHVNGEDTSFNINMELCIRRQSKMKYP